MAAALIGHARDRHPAYAKKPRCLFQVQQRLVNGGIGRWRRRHTASGERASQCPDYHLKQTRQRYRTVSWHRRGQRSGLISHLAFRARPGQGLGMADDGYRRAIALALACVVLWGGADDDRAWG